VVTSEADFDGFDPDNAIVIPLDMQDDSEEFV